MTFDPQATLDALVSHAKRLGVFERVYAHEPKNAPGNGLSCVIWGDRIDPIRSSGLNSVSLRVAYSVRVYKPMNSEPQDGIDPTILNGVTALWNAYAGDFTLDGEARQVDLLGAYGAAMSAQAGYLNQDGRLFRVMTLTLPIIFDDVFEEVP